MGVSSQCIESTVTIESDKINGALEALKEGFYGEKLRKCSNLIQAFEIFEMESDLKNEDITNIRFVGGKGDNSMFVWPILAPYIRAGSYIKMSIDGEIEVTKFKDGDFEVEYSGEDEEYYEDLSEEAYEFFEKISEGSVGRKEIDTIYESEGNIDFVNSSGNTPLMEACYSASGEEDYDEGCENKKNIDYMKIIKMILDKSPDLNVQNNYGETVLTMAIATNNVDLVKVLMSQENLVIALQKNPLEVAADHLSIEIIEIMVKNGFEPKKTNALNVACSTHEYDERKISVVKLLVEKYDCDVNRSSSADFNSWDGELKRGYTPLMAAALSDDLKVTNYLIFNAADPNLTDDKNNTALHYCSGQTWVRGDCRIAWTKRDKNEEVIKSLLNAGAIIGLKNISGSTCLDIEKKQKNEGAIKIFEEF